MPTTDRGRVRVRTAVQRVRSGDGPLIEATPCRSPADEAPDAHPGFAPIRLPGLARLLLRDIDARLVNDASARVSAILSAGQHSFPLADGPGLIVRVAPGTRVDVDLRLGSPDATWPEGPVVQALSVDLRPAIVLPNVLQALTDLRHLFEDRTFDVARRAWEGPLGRSLRRAGAAALEATGVGAILRSSLEGQDGLGGLGQIAPVLVRGARDRFDALGKALSEGALEPGEVHLARVSGRPRWNASECRWELELSFSGHVRLLESVTWPFEDVVVPSSILPALHASLAGLLSGDPLATGVLHGERVKRRAVLRAFWDALVSAEGSVEVSGTPPVIGLSSRLVDRTGLVLRGELPETCRLTAGFDARRDGNRLVVRIPEAAAGFPGGTVRTRATADVVPDFDAPGSWIPHLPSGEFRFQVLPDSVLPAFEGRSRSSHPLAVGTSSVRVRVEDVRPSGGMDVEWGPEGVAVRLRPEGIGFDARVSMPRQDAVRLSDAGLGLELRDGTLSARVRPSRGGPWRASVKGGCVVEQRARVDVVPIPELRIEDPVLRQTLRASVRFDLSARVHLPEAGSGEFRVDPKGRLDVRVDEAGAELDGRRIAVPAGTSLSAAWREGLISSDGLGAFGVDLEWRLPDGSPLHLSGPDGRVVPIDLAPLKRGRLAVHVSPGGRVSLDRGGGPAVPSTGLLSALIGDDVPESVKELLSSGELLDLAARCLDLFDADLAGRVVGVRDAVLAVRRHLDEEGVRTAGDAVPRERLSRLLSRFLAGDTSLARRLDPLVAEVVEGRGIRLRDAKNLVAEALPDLDADYEVDRLLRWVDLVVRPGTPHPRGLPIEAPPIDLDPRYAEAVRGLPSAADLYAAADAASCPLPLQRQVADLAPELALAQLDRVLERARGRWDASCLRRISYVRASKRMVARIDAEAASIAAAARAVTIGGFLGEAVGPLPGIDDGLPDAPPPCALGPMDVAVLLHAGLASPAIGLQSQVNNRLLLELIRSRDGGFLRSVLIEMGQQVPRILAGVLMAFLNQDQRRMKEPIDVAALVEDRLGLPVPRLEDYMAGGRRVRDSYYLDLSRLADAILSDAGPWLARRTHLREVHHPIEAPLRLPSAGPAKALEADARAAVASADRAGRRAIGARAGDRTRDAARNAFRDAFAACSAFLDEVPTGFVRPWMKGFWRRNEEALKVLSVVRNAQEDVDDVRRWLAVASGRPVPADESALIDGVIDAVYALADDRQALKEDPLVRLAIDPPARPLAFTIVSAMGVVTDGSRGRELEDAYRRLAERRGVRVVRADTGLFKSLEFNASAILRAIQSVEGPWGWIGYSQGCANGLLAESFLNGGTPDQRRVLDRFVARNLLFSAANGSAHGTCGTEKMLRAMVEGERFLKAYQARYSRQLVDLFLRSLQVALDSRLLVETLGGAHSLTLERAIALHRDGQFVSTVPTSTTIGQVSRDRLPELLEWLYSMHELQNPGVGHDSQVPVDEAVGRATRVRNARTEAFARCDIGSRIQATHHWSPLTVEIEPFTTRRDRDRAVYQGPKDRHVFPWVDTLARFGRIRPAG